MRNVFAFLRLNLVDKALEIVSAELRIQTFDDAFVVNGVVIGKSRDQCLQSVDACRRLEDGARADSVPCHITRRYRNRMGAQRQFVKLQSPDLSARFDRQAK